MKSTKRAASIILAISMIFTSSMVAFATESEPINATEVKTSALETTDSLTSAGDGTIRPNEAVLYWRFNKTSESTDKTSAAVVKVSADMTGPGSIVSSITKTITETFSISLSSDQKSLVRASATASIGSSVSTTLGYSLNVDAGKTGYMAFQPYLSVVKGNLEQYNSLYPNVVLTSKATTAKFPKKLTNGTADGKYYIKYY